MWKTGNTGAKYRNKKVAVDGIQFDSKGEAKRFALLSIMQRAGEISDLQRQVTFDFIVNDVKVAKYIADFTYQENGALVVEDFKSAHTRKLPVYRLKKKLMLACHGIQIRETTK